MRLVHSATLELREYVRGQTPDYVILSHRWIAGDQELTFEDMKTDRSSDRYRAVGSKRGYSKVLGACDRAARDGFDWIWIDSCCIDRSSSAELQESINSMWDYYANANMCYALLSDVPNVTAGRGEAFAKSEWWSRGWTLQELLAPEIVEFYAADWAPIGTRAERYEEIASFTGISSDALTKSFSMDAFSAAGKLSWAAHRQVTREEDESYALLGIFEVNLPLLYGEGRERAFARLEEAIFAATYDSSIFLFRYSPFHDFQPLLADGATRFCQQQGCDACQRHSSTCFPLSVSYEHVVPRDIWTRQAHENIFTTVTQTRSEVSTSLQLLPYTKVASKLRFLDGKRRLVDDASHVAVLNFTLESDLESALCLLLLQNETSGDAFKRLTCCPALLSSVQDYESEMQTRKALIVPDVRCRDDRSVVVTFVVDSDCCIVRAWKAHGIQLMPEHRTPGHSTTAQILEHGTREKAAELSVSLGLISISTSVIKLSLIRLDSVWSIREVHVAKIYKSKRRQKDRKLYTSNVRSDRCTVCLSNGTEIAIALRRLAASNRPQTEDTVKSYRYVISLRSL